MVAIQELLFLMKPKACPSPLVRIGGCEDGAYLVPDDLKGIESCFSPDVLRHFIETSIFLPKNL